MRLMLALAATTCLVAVPAIAQDEADEGFDLGRITVIGERSDGVEITGQTLSSEAMLAFNRVSLDTAIDLVPGANSSNSGGSRNERLIYVRGFDRFQVPLLIDGVRIYLPADNRLDYGRFLTPDIAEVQVSKGYASVLDGPGGMGGLINLVTRRPTAAFEATGRGRATFDDDGYNGYSAFGMVGAERDRWYAQGSYARNEVEHWRLSDDFTPINALTEDGGERDFSATEDWRGAVKIGFTPNATDEYALSYTYQEGSKNAPLHVSDPLNTQRNWAWPYWNLDVLQFASTTAFGDNVTLDGRLFYNTFDNLLRSFNDRTQTTQSLGRAFNSYYEDQAWGGSAKLAWDIAETDTLSVAFHYRADEHVEFQQSFPAGTTEPPQTNREDTYSLALENRMEILPSLSFTAGMSYDWRDLQKAQEFGAVPGLAGNRLFSYPIEDATALNGQGRLDWAVGEATDLYALVSSRSRFPTIFERFSSRFGGAVSNPDLEAEQATTYEVGGSTNVGPLRLEGAVFYSDLQSVIVAFPFIFTTCTPAGVCTPNAVTQSRNVGEGEYAGAEIAFSARLLDTLLVGGAYSHVDRELVDPSNAAFRPTGVPENKGFLYAAWSPIPRLTVTPNLDFASERWTVNTAGTLYYETGDYVLGNLTVDFDLTDRIAFTVGGRNLADENYTLTDGFPEQGRSWFVGFEASY